VEQILQPYVTSSKQSEPPISSPTLQSIYNQLSVQVTPQQIPDHYISSSQSLHSVSSIQFTDISDDDDVIIYGSGVSSSLIPPAKLYHGTNPNWISSDHIACIYKKYFPQHLHCFQIREYYTDDRQITDYDDLKDFIYSTLSNNLWCIISFLLGGHFVQLLVLKDTDNFHYYYFDPLYDHSDIVWNAIQHLTPNAELCHQLVPYSIQRHGYECAHFGVWFIDASITFLCNAHPTSSSYRKYILELLSAFKYDQVLSHIMTTFILPTREMKNDVTNIPDIIKYAEKTNGRLIIRHKKKSLLQ
jgi:hypothetical protein